MNSAVKEALSPIRFLDILKGAPSVSLHVETYGDTVCGAFVPSRLELTCVFLSWTVIMSPAVPFLLPGLLMTN